MEMGRNMPCSGSRPTTQSAQVVRFVALADEQSNQDQGLRGRVRNFCGQIRGRMYQNTVTPSLNLHPTESNSTMRSSKRAVLCGITYNNSKHDRLKGPFNDVRNMRELLITKFGYPGNCIRVLTEEEAEPQFIPTRKNIEDSLRWLVNDCRRGDSLVFFYTGHGSQLPDFNNDEASRFDQTICPVDYQEAGMILDNDLNSLIVRPLTRGVTLHAIVDACHSGTILDLPKVYTSLERRWENNNPPSGVKKCTNGGLVISISACQDDQSAADTSVFTAGKMNGALTYILAEILKKLPGPTYGDLFDLINETIDNVNQSHQRFAHIRILRRLFDYDSYLSQTPLLSSSAEFDVYKKHLFL